VSRKSAARYGKIILTRSGHKTGARLVRLSQNLLGRKFAQILNREYLARTLSRYRVEKTEGMIFK
jgi:hypothetical protein